MKTATLPPEFTSLTGKVNHVQQISPIEFCSSCPVCGDTGHQGHDTPDRFRIFLGDGNPRAWCRRCGYFIWADQTDANKPMPTRIELDKWRNEQIARAENARHKIEQSLTMLRNSALWDKLHDNLDRPAKAYWARRGILDGWQEFWRLGWHGIRNWGGVTCDAASIPVFGPGWDIQQIKYRLTDETAGRYRYEIIGGGSPPFLCDPDADYSGHVVAIEGEIKSMVTFSRLGDGKTCIIGVPGTNPGQDVIEMLMHADRVTLVMDPGAKAAGIATARKIGISKTRLLETTVKINDGIIAGNLDKRDIKQILGSAIRLSDWIGAKA